MTGLRPQTDIILEVACKVTDLDYKTLDEYQAVVKPDIDIQDLLNDFSRQAHTDSGLLDKLSSGQTSDAVEAALIDFVERHFGQEKVVIAGNSIYMDRQFINYWWPQLAARLHYRMLDVSAFKILAQAKYGLFYTKKEAHRALDDIQESIDELVFYEQHMDLKHE